MLQTPFPTQNTPGKSLYYPIESTAPYDAASETALARSSSNMSAHPRLRGQTRRGAGWFDKIGQAAYSQVMDPDSILRSKVIPMAQDENSVLRRGAKYAYDAYNAPPRGAGYSGGAAYDQMLGGRLFRTRKASGAGYSGGGYSGGGYSGGAGPSPAQQEMRARVAANPSFLANSPGAKAWRDFRAAERAKGVPYPAVVTAWRAMKGKGPKRSHAAKMAAMGGSFYLA